MAYKYYCSSLEHCRKYVNALWDMHQGMMGVLQFELTAYKNSTNHLTEFRFQKNEQTTLQKYINNGCASKTKSTIIPLSTVGEYEHFCELGPLKSKVIYGLYNQSCKMIAHIEVLE